LFNRLVRKGLHSPQTSTSLKTVKGVMQGRLDYVRLLKRSVNTEYSLDSSKLGELPTSDAALLDVGKGLLSLAFRYFESRHYIEGYDRLERLSLICKELQYAFPSADVMAFAAKRMFALGHLLAGDIEIALACLQRDIAAAGGVAIAGMIDSLILLSDSYTCLRRYNEALHTARLAVDTAHANLETKKHSIVIAGLKSLPESESFMVLSEFDAVSLSYFTIAKKLEDAQLGPIAVEWYERAHSSATKFNLNPSTAKEFWDEWGRAKRYWTSPPSNTSSSVKFISNKVKVKSSKSGSGQPGVRTSNPDVSHNALSTNTSNVTIDITPAQPVNNDSPSTGMQNSSKGTTIRPKSAFSKLGGSYNQEITSPSHNNQIGNEDVELSTEVRPIEGKDDDHHYNNQDPADDKDHGHFTKHESTKASHSSSTRKKADSKPLDFFPPLYSFASPSERMLEMRKQIPTEKLAASVLLNDMIRKNERVLKELDDEEQKHKNDKRIHHDIDFEHIRKQVKEIESNQRRKKMKKLALGGKGLSTVGTHEWTLWGDVHMALSGFGAHQAKSEFKCGEELKVEDIYVGMNAEVDLTGSASYEGGLKGISTRETVTHEMTVKNKKENDKWFTCQVIRYHQSSNNMDENENEKDDGFPSEPSHLSIICYVENLGEIHTTLKGGCFRIPISFGDSKLAVEAFSGHHHAKIFRPGHFVTARKGGLAWKSAEILSYEIICEFDEETKSEIEKPFYTVHFEDGEIESGIPHSKIQMRSLKKVDREVNKSKEHTVGAKVLVNFKASRFRRLQNLDTDEAEWVPARVLDKSKSGMYTVGYERTGETETNVRPNDIKVEKDNDDDNQLENNQPNLKTKEIRGGSEFLGAAAKLRAVISKEAEDGMEGMRYILHSGDRARRKYRRKSVADTQMRKIQAKVRSILSRKKFKHKQTLIDLLTRARELKKELIERQKIIVEKVVKATRK